MQPLTVKKKKGDAVTKGAKIGAVVGATRGALGGAGVAKALGMSNKAALGIGAAQAAGGAVKGAIMGAGIGAGVKAVKNRKKAKFSNFELTEFSNDAVIEASFPKFEVKSEPVKSAFELASERVKNRDKLPSSLDEYIKGS